MTAPGVLHRGRVGLRRAGGEQRHGRANGLGSAVRRAALARGVGPRDRGASGSLGGLARLGVFGPTVLALAGVAALGAALGGGHVDLEVYRRAGERWLVGADPYADRPELPFTYPPFAAALASVVARAPTVALVVLGLATVGVAAWATLAAAGFRGATASARPGLLPLVAAVAVASEPVLRGLHLGQVNGVVVGLVLVDLLVLPDRYRGWLTGLAAGLKLTPLVFALHLAARRERAAIARLLGAFGATVTLGFVALPVASLRYWGALVGDAARVGDPAYADNQSLLGVAARLAPGSATPLWLAASAVVLAVAAVGLREARPVVESVVVCGLVGLLVAPISWSHHWLLLPAAAVLCWRRGARTVAVLTIVVALGFSGLTDWSHTVGHTGFPAAVGAVAANAMTVAGLGCLVVLCLWTGRGRRGRTDPPVQNSGWSQKGVGMVEATAVRTPHGGIGSHRDPSRITPEERRDGLPARHA